MFLAPFSGSAFLPSPVGEKLSQTLRYFSLVAPGVFHGEKKLLECECLTLYLRPLLRKKPLPSTTILYFASDFTVILTNSQWCPVTSAIGKEMLASCLPL